MKLLLINPTRYKADQTLYKSRYRWLLGITLPYLAALTPPDVETEIIDECWQEIDFDRPCDLVGISFMTHQTPRAYHIADEFRKRGRRVVMGGFHASACPHEALEHADSVVIGEAELVWAQVIADAQHGCLQPTYKAPALHDLRGLPSPRFDLLDLARYKMPAVDLFYPVQTTRGCPFGCRFCEVTFLYGRSYRFRPIEDVLRDIHATGSSAIYFIDDNIAANRKRAVQLFEALKPLKIRWTGLINMATAKDTDLLDLMKESGCAHLNLGMESINPASLEEMNKRHNPIQDYEQIFENLRSRKLFFSVNVVFGWDHDDLQTLQHTIDFMIRQQVPMAYMFILTPRVGTALRADWERDGRILTNDWTRYAGWNAVYQPAQMSPAELEASFMHAYRKFYSLPSIIRRLLPRRLKINEWWIALVTNIFYAWGLYHNDMVPTAYY